MAAAELADMGSLHTWTHPGTDRRSKGTLEDALVRLRRGVRANFLAVMTTNTSQRARLLSSSAGPPIRVAITPCRITIAPFTSVLSRSNTWIAEALDDGLRLAVIVDNVRLGWIFRRLAKFVGTRIIVLYDGR
jgi:hypothetical protein